MLRFYGAIYHMCKSPSTTLGIYEVGNFSGVFDESAFFFGVVNRERVFERDVARDTAFFKPLERSGDAPLTLPQSDNRGHSLKFYGDVFSQLNAPRFGGVVGNNFEIGEV